MNQGQLARLLRDHESRVTPEHVRCTCGGIKMGGYEAYRWHLAEVILAALSPPRGVEAPEEELGALLERLAPNAGDEILLKRGSCGSWWINGVSQMSLIGLIGNILALRALDAAVAEQQQQKSEEEGV